MKYYQEITLIDDDQPLYDIWSDLYKQIHIALADLANNHSIHSVGVSFPNYRYEEKKKTNEEGESTIKAFGILGNKLRLFAPSSNELVKLQLNKWLKELKDYVEIGYIEEVGDKATSYISVHRYRFKPIEVQAQSLAEKLDISLDDALATVAKRTPEKPVPYIRLTSETNKSPYLLKVLQQPADTPKPGTFNTYGMNGMRNKVTVPHW